MYKLRNSLIARVGMRYNKTIPTLLIVTRLGKELRSGDVVAIMSNGGFGGIHEKLLTTL